jgi:subtilase family serine protease
VEERVLGVGGTMITVRDPLTEVAWSGPLPLGIQPLLPQMRALAGSGGFSDTVPVPAWQEKAFDDYYPRGTGSPAVVPYGRGFPDVALMASGPAIQPKRDDDAMSCLGYQALTAEGWVDYAAGTSVGAPIWAAIVALANEAREKNGLGPLGWANPRLYEAATAEPRAFRPVLNGAADPVMWALNDQGQAVPYHFDGYQCTAGWDPVTGLGVPDVSVLIDHLRADPAQ